jgi:hypothetical protein
VPQGDDLTVVLFLVTVALTFGIEAVKAETSARQISFGIAAAACCLSGLLWTSLKEASPRLSDWVVPIATNPMAWFIVLMFIAAIFAFSPTKKRPKQDNIVQNDRTSLPLSIKPEENKDKPKSFIDVAPSSLLEMRNKEGLTRVQTDRMLAPYIGKWIKYTGPIKNVSERHVVLSINGSDYNTVFGRFITEHRDRFHLLEIGKTITIIGQIEDVFSSEVSLDDCELVGG